MTYKVYLSSAPKPASFKKGKGIIVLEPDNYTKEQIKQIKDKGYTVLGYISIGTIEKERPWYKKYRKYGLKRLEDWPDEVYADVRKTNWRCFLVSRAKAIKAKGFDGWWCDNLDVYEYYPSIKMFSACKAVLKQIKKIGGYVMVNGGSRFLAKLINVGRVKNVIDGYTQEEVFSKIISYKGKGKFGKQETEERRYYQTLIIRLQDRGIGIFLLEYTTDVKLRETIRKWCKSHKASCCISGDVNL